MRYRFYICDVFTDRPFGGNQLAVLPEAAGLTDAGMQQIAREFNFSESAFVFPAERGHTRKVRIFTPTREVPFAGHPNIGAAFVLTATGACGSLEQSVVVTFEEKGGIVPVSIEKRNAGRMWCELEAPERVSFGETLSIDLIASALSLNPGDVVTTSHPPQVVSAGLPFVITELSSPDVLSRVRINVSGFDAIATIGVTPDLHVYTRSLAEGHLRARVFAPLDGVPEDPATGSATCALAGLLAQNERVADGDFRWSIRQGIEMGRGSVLEASAEKRDGAVLRTRVGGQSVIVADGYIDIV